MIRLVVGLLLVFLGAAFVLDAWLNPSRFQGSSSDAIIGFCILFIVPGSALAYFGQKSRRKKRDSGPASASRVATPAAAGLQAAFGMVLVIGKYDAASPLYVQAEAHLLEKISSAPRYPLSQDAKITAIRASSLPAETKAALEPYVWTLQSRHGRRGGKWQAEFYDPLGLHFLVLYLE